MKPKVNILVAYPYFNQQMFEYLRSLDPGEFRLIVDSGAFTAWNTGREIKLDDYCKFLEQIAFLRPFHAVQLDVFGDPEGSWKNFEIMKERGFDVMPVFTRGESLERLERMYEETDYIMFGGVVVGRSNKNYVKWFSERNKGRKVHWLGFTNIDFIKHYKPESVDSSSWASADRYGSLSLYLGNGKLKSLHKSVFSKNPTKKIVDGFRRIGVSVEELSILRHKESWINSGRHDGDLNPKKEDKRASPSFVCTLSHLLRSIEVERQVGTKMYLALCTPWQARTLMNAYKFLTKRGVI